LRNGVHIAVGGEEWRHQQCSALQALGIAHCGNGNVNARALRAEGGEVGSHHHCRDIACADRLPTDIYAKPFEHRGQRLFSERNVIEGIAGAVKPDDQAIPDQLILPHALDIGEILDARRRLGFYRDANRQDRNQACSPQSLRHHCSPM
jgi:hypothetical protein